MPDSGHLPEEDFTETLVSLPRSVGPYESLEQLGAEEGRSVACLRSVARSVPSDQISVASDRGESDDLCVGSC